MKTKICSLCKIMKSRRNFYKNRTKSSGLQSRCKMCKYKEGRKWYQSHKKMAHAATHRYTYKLRTKIIEAYGGKCTCCGESARGFLTIEHIKGGGQQHEDRVGGPIQMYRDIIASGFPNIYTILCWNCNCATRFGKICPHKTKKRRDDGQQY